MPAEEAPLAEHHKRHSVELAEMPNRPLRHMPFTYEHQLTALAAAGISGFHRQQPQIQVVPDKPRRFYLPPLKSKALRNKLFLTHGGTFLSLFGFPQKKFKQYDRMSLFLSPFRNKLPERGESSNG
jgi:hypothetical protein